MDTSQRKIHSKYHSVNPLYFIVDKGHGFIEEKDGNKDLNVASTDNNKEVLKKYTELSDGIKNLIEKIDNKPGEYGKHYMKIKFNLIDNMSLNKSLKLHNLKIIVGSAFQENSKYYQHIFLDECLRNKNDRI